MKKAVIKNCHVTFFLSEKNETPVMFDVRENRMVDYGKCFVFNLDKSQFSEMHVLSLRISISF